MSDALDDAEIAQVRDAVHEAGRIAMRYFQKSHERWEKQPGQVVTEADIAIDRFLHAELRRRHADDGWLSEETEDDPVRMQRHRVWVVDPIDGTRSFAEGVPEFTISVALLVGNVPALGFVYNPALDEMLEGHAGGGARLNGRRMRASTITDLADARVVASRFESRRRNFAALIPTSGLTTIGSLAYKLALVAAARYDAFLSWRRTRDWDIAAAALLLQEAGALLTDAAGEPIRFNQPDPCHHGLVAGPPALHRALRRAAGPAYAAYCAERKARGLDS